MESGCKVLIGIGIPRELCAVDDWCRRNVAYVIGCWRTEAEFAFVVDKGDSHRTRSTQNANKMATVESCSARSQ